MLVEIYLKERQGERGKIQKKEILLCASGCINWVKNFQINFLLMKKKKCTQNKTATKFGFTQRYKRHTCNFFHVYFYWSFFLRPLS